jgi:hypothetical protein
LGVAAWQSPSRLLETATVKYTLYGFPIAGTIAAAVVAWAGALALAKLSRRPWSSLACVLPAAVLALRLGAGLVPALSAQKSVQQLWSSYLAVREDGDRIGLAGEVKFGCFYYSDNAIEEVGSAMQLREFLAGAGQRYLILPRKDHRERFAAAPEHFGRFEPIDESHPTHLLVRHVPGGSADNIVGEDPAADLMGNLDGLGLVD